MHNKIETDELLRELRRVASEVSGKPGAEDMTSIGEYGANTYCRRFGSWSNAVEKIGYDPDNRFTDEELLDDLRSFAEELGHTPGKKEMVSDGPHSDQTYALRFGSWTDACVEAGLGANGYDVRKGDYNIAREDLISELQQLADDLGRRPGAREMQSDGAYSYQVYRQRFGSWNEAVEAAGIEPHLGEYTEENLLDELHRLAEELGRTPKYSDVEKEGQFATGTYESYFGSYTAAIREAGLLPYTNLIKEDLVTAVEEMAEDLGRPPTPIEMDDVGKYSPLSYRSKFDTWVEVIESAGFDPSEYAHIDEMGIGLDTILVHRRYYGPNWEEQRRKTRERDSYRCQSCGTTQEEHKEARGEKLHVHHIRPFRTFDDYEDANDLDNLVTLCRGCHQGKWEGIPLRPQLVAAD